MYGHHKYIVFDNEWAVVFPEKLIHADVAKAISNVARREYLDGIPSSAGFVCWSSEKKEAHAYGESESLRLKSNPEYDSVLINNLIGR